MKKHQSVSSIIKCSAISALALSSPLLAIERPAPAAQPEEKAGQQKAGQQEQVAEEAIPMPEVNAQETAFLGVYGQPISDTLATHLNLAKGTGIELEYIAANSPASKAGLKKRDIIISLAGKKITSINDLEASIADKKPGDTVEIKFISKGKAVTKTLILEAKANFRKEKEADGGNIPQQKKGLPNNLGEPRLPKEFLEKFPEKDREKLMKLLKGDLEGLDLQELQHGLGKLEGFDLKILPKGLNPEMNKGLKFKGAFQSRMKMLDADGSITLKSTKKGKVIELLDKEGKLQYRGPYNNEADKKNVPQELRHRVANLDVKDGLGLGLGFNPLDAQKAGEAMKFPFKKIAGMEGAEKELMKQLPKEIQQLLKQPNLPNANKLNGANRFEFNFSKSSFTTSRTDPTTGNRYTFKKEGKNKQVEVYDLRGQLLYDGPYNSDADKASVPNEYRDFIEQLDGNNPVQKANKIKLKLGK